MKRSAANAEPDAQMVGFEWKWVLTKVQSCMALWEQTTDEELLSIQLQQQLPHKRELTGTVKKQCGTRVLSKSNLGNIVELSIAGHVLEWARQSNFSGGLSTHSSMLVVTTREGEERGIYNAALKELLKIVKDQIEERSAVVLVWNKEQRVRNLELCNHESTVTR